MAEKWGHSVGVLKSFYRDLGFDMTGVRGTHRF